MSRRLGSMSESGEFPRTGISNALALGDVCTGHCAQHCPNWHISPLQRGFGHNYNIHKCECSTSHSCASWDDSFSEDSLFWSLSCLGHDEFRRLYAQDPCFNFQVLDHLLFKADFKEKNRISDRLLQKISDIAVLDEVRMSLAFDRRFKPRVEKLLQVVPNYLLLTRISALVGILRG